MKKSRGKKGKIIFTHDSIPYKCWVALQNEEVTKKKNMAFCAWWVWKEAISMLFSLNPNKISYKIVKIIYSFIQLAWFPITANPKLYTPFASSIRNSSSYKPLSVSAFQHPCSGVRVLDPSFHLSFFGFGKGDSNPFS